MDEKEVQQLQAKLAAAEERARNLENQNLEIRAANEKAGAAIEDLQQQVDEAKSVPGVPRGLEADVRRRVAAGLPLQHAIQAAISQAENDKALAVQAKAAEAAEKAAAKKKGQE